LIKSNLKNLSHLKGGVNMRKSVSLILITAMVLTMVIGMAGTAFADTAWTTRLAGATRIETAVEISNVVGSAGDVVLARSDMYPDALAGGVLAQTLGCPVLLTSSTSLDAATKAEITRLAATNVYILGGTAAISAAVATEVDAMTGVSITRLAGADRYETATMIADATLLPLANIVVCTGENFPDALCASYYGQPIILTGSNSVPQKTMDWIQANRTAIGTTKVTFIGGTVAISDSVKNEMVNACPSAASIVRKAGADRYATCVEVLKDTVGNVANDLVLAGGACFTTGTNFPDALAGGALNLPVILTPISSSVQTWLDTVCPDDSIVDRQGVYVLGGTSAVNTSTEEAIAKEVSCNGWVKPAVPAITSAAAAITSDAGVAGTAEAGDVITVTVATNWKLSTDASTSLACDTVDEVQVDTRALGPDDNTTYKSTWAGMVLDATSTDGTKATWVGTCTVVNEDVPQANVTETFGCVANTAYNQTSATVVTNGIKVYN